MAWIGTHTEAHTGNPGASGLDCHITEESQYLHVKPTIPIYFKEKTSKLEQQDAVVEMEKLQPPLKNKGKGAGLSDPCLMLDTYNYIS